MIVKPFTHENIDFIFGNLWQRGEDEAALCGFSTDALREQYEHMIDAPFSLAFYDNDTPCALCYLESISECRYRTHFVATEAGFSAIWLPLTLFLRKFSDRIVMDGRAIEILADPRNTKAREWYEAMGFIFYSRDGKLDKYVKFDKINSTHQAIGHGAYSEVPYVL